VHCALLTRYTPPTGGTIFHLTQYIPTIWLIALIEDPAVIVRFLGHLGLPTDIPKARAPPLHLVGDAPPTEVAGSSTNPPDPACSPSARQTCASASGIALDRSPQDRHNALPWRPVIRVWGAPIRLSARGVSVEGALMSSIVP